jgi:hypothetical protein
LLRSVEKYLAQGAIREAPDLHPEIMASVLDFDGNRGVALWKAPAAIVALRCASVYLFHGQHSSIGRLRGGHFFVLVFVVMRGHGARVAPSHAGRNLLEPLLGATAGRLSR